MYGFVVEDPTKFWFSGPKAPKAPKAPNYERLPVYIWYDFQRHQVAPTRISFHPRRADTNAADRRCNLERKTPTQFQFVGSNDAVCHRNSTWTILCEDRSGKPFASQDETRQCSVDDAAPLPLRPKFRCLGLKILAVNSGNDRFGACLSGIRMWTRESGLIPFVRLD